MVLKGLKFYDSANSEHQRASSECGQFCSSLRLASGAVTSSFAPDQMIMQCKKSVPFENLMRNFFFLRKHWSKLKRLTKAEVKG